MSSIVGVGEALFDVFEDGTEVVGGAPLNFAVHANRFAGRIGTSALVVSRVGADKRGAAICGFVGAAGMSCAFLQQDTVHATGTVQVKLAAGQPSYEIVSDAAWDYLESSVELDELADRCELVCYGTLGQRSITSRASIEGFLVRAKGALRLFDVNLRQSFYDYSTLQRGCALATVVKVNEEELGVLASMLTLRGASSGDRVLSLLERFPVDVVIVTRGPAGTAIYTAHRKFEGPAVRYPFEDGADSVGAGDAATAGAAVAMLAGHAMNHVVDIANHAGAYVASRRGGTPALPEDILRMMDRR